MPQKSQLTRAQHGLVAFLAYSVFVEVAKYEEFCILYTSFTEDMTRPLTTFSKIFITSDVKATDLKDFISLEWVPQ